MSAFADALSTAIQRRPLVLRMVSGLARRISPVWVVGHTVIALGSDAVRQVFERADYFELGPIGHRKMLMGPFLLGMDPRGSYHKERELLGDVLKRLHTDLTAIARSRAREAHARLAERIGHGGATIEVVSEFAEPVVTRIVSDFFGVPFPDQQRSGFVAGSGEDLLAAWLRKVGSVIASTSPAPFGLQRIAEGSGLEFGAYLDDQIEVRRRSGKRGADVLGELLALESSGKLDGARIRPNLAGLMLAGSTAIVKSFVGVLRQLRVKRPHDRESHWLPAFTAAHLASGTASVDQIQGERDLRALIFEALRFEPTFPVLVRYAPRETQLGEGERARTVPAGSTVYAVPIAAMFDDIVEDADTFSERRPVEHYLHFGSGQHECLGRDVATTVLLEMLREFLTLPGMDQAKPGRIRYDGPAVHRFDIRVPRVAS